MRALAALVVVTVALSPLAPAGWGVLAPAAHAQQPDFVNLPKGPGQETVFYTCSACHSIRLVTQQRLTRGDWDEVLHYMVDDHEMPEPDAEDRKILLDFLGKYLGRDVPR